MNSDFRSWYLENADLFEHLHGHNTILFSHIKDIIDSLAIISDMQEVDIDSDLETIFDTGYAYLYNYVSILKNYLNNCFDNNFHRLLDYDTVLSYIFYVNDLKELLVEKDKYSDEIRLEFEDVLTTLEDILVNKKKYDDEFIKKIDNRLLLIMSNEEDFLTVPEIFTNVRDRLKI